jgi:uncharacterized protein (TIGR02145 family)
VLENYVANDGYRDNVSQALKSRSGWSWKDRKGKSGNGTDVYGFSAQPAGTRLQYYFAVTFRYMGIQGFWWTATEDDQINKSAWYCHILDGGTYVSQSYSSKSFGKSVRCVKD